MSKISNSARIPFHIAEKQNVLRSNFPSFPRVHLDMAKSSGALTKKDSLIWGENCWLEYSNKGFKPASEVKPFFTSISDQEFKSGVKNFYVEVLASAQPEIQQHLHFAQFCLNLGAEV